MQQKLNDIKFSEKKKNSLCLIPQHDNDPVCAPGGRDPDGNYIMFPSATRGTLVNNHRFSPCSISNISAILVPLFEGRSNRENCFQSKENVIEQSVFQIQ